MSTPHALLVSLGHQCCPPPGRLPLGQFPHPGIPECMKGRVGHRDKIATQFIPLIFLPNFPKGPVAFHHKYQTFQGLLDTGSELTGIPEDPNVPLARQPE